jgi:hypothetical protein
MMGYGHLGGAAGAAAAAAAARGGHVGMGGMGGMGSHHHGAGSHASTMLQHMAAAAAAGGGGGAMVGGGGQHIGSGFVRRARDAPPEELKPLQDMFAQTLPHIVDPPAGFMPIQHEPSIAPHEQEVGTFPV